MAGLSELSNAFQCAVIQNHAENWPDYSEQEDVYELARQRLDLTKSYRKQDKNEIKKLCEEVRANCFKWGSNNFILIRFADYEGQELVQSKGLRELLASNFLVEAEAEERRCSSPQARDEGYSRALASCYEQEGGKPRYLIIGCIVGEDEHAAWSSIRGQGRRSCNSSGPLCWISVTSRQSWLINIGQS